MALALPEDLYHAVMAAAAPVTPTQQPLFLEALAAELRDCPEIGPGVVHRAAAALQRKFVVEARATAMEEEGRRQATETKQARFGRSKARAIGGVA
jgi:hypothetical protein